MRYLKMLGAAAIALMALMAFTASSALATTLENGSGTLKSGSAIDASLSGAENAKLETSGGTILDECSGSTIEGVTGNESALYIAGVVAKADTTWSGCSKTTNTLSGGEFEIKWTSGSNGSFWLSELTTTVNTIFGSCIYGYNLLTQTVGEVKGGSPATLAINTFIRRMSGSALCPEIATLRANYTITGPSTFRVTS